MESQDFEDGAVVKLRSGGPAMTVVGSADELIRVIYFVEAEIRTLKFRAVLLRRACVWEY